MMCCACAGSCNHIGNHAFCAAHGGQPVITFGYTYATNSTVRPSRPEPTQPSRAPRSRRYRGRHRMSA